MLLCSDGHHGYISGDQEWKKTFEPRSNSFSGNNKHVTYKIVKWQVSQSDAETLGQSMLI